MLYQDIYSAVSVKLDFRDRLTVMRSITDTDNEFIECQTPRKKLQSIGISRVSLQAFMKTLKSNISEVHRVQVNCVQVDSYDKNDMKEKLNDFVRLQEAMQEKLKIGSYSEQIQILTLVPYKWSRMYCLEYFNVFEYLV